MNLILLEPEDFVDERRVRLRGRRQEHVRQVHRAREGDQLRVGRIDGLLGHGTVTSNAGGSLELDVELSDRPPAKLPVTLAVALPRPPSVRKILQAGTALGVPRFVFFDSRRVEKSYWQSSALRPGELRRQLCLGLEQARDTVLPEVVFEQRFATFIDDLLPALAGAGPIWFAHPDAGTLCPRGGEGPTVLLLGPEGGWLDLELGRLRARGAFGFTLGERVLRVETAAVALLSRIF